jgi:hypothetical protein
MPEINHRPMGENSPNLVTLMRAFLKYSMHENKLAAIALRRNLQM